MSILIPESQLHIDPFHRLIRDLNGLSGAEFLEKLQLHFEITSVAAPHIAKPTEKHQFGLYLGSEWYLLKLKEQVPPQTPVDDLDPQILTNTVLSPLLHINDLRTDHRIFCIGGKEGAYSIEKLVNSGQYTAGFWLYPVSVEQMKRIADAQMIMPPKSTWVEPKLRSGLTVFRFEQGMTLE